MRRNFLKLFAGLTVFFVLLVLADVANAQRRARARTYSQQQVEQLLERIEERTDNFVKVFDEALDDSRLDTTRTEENYTDRARQLENFTDELRREFDHDDSWRENRPEAQKVLSAATVMDRIMRSRNFGAQAETSWVRLRTELNTLARVYTLPVVGSRSYGAVPVRTTTIPVQQVIRRNGYTKQQVEQLLERIEERTDAFVKSFDEALDDSRLNRTRTEENYTDRARLLENATDELRREFDHDRAWEQDKVNARKVLNIASDINRIMRSRNFGARTESTWAVLRTELNALARVYSLPAVGARSYR